MLIRLILLLLIPSIVLAAPPSRQHAYSPNTTIASTDVTENENVLFNYLQAGVDTYADSSIFNADISPSANIQSDKLNLTSIAQNISNTGTITATSFIGGGSLPSGAVFFMFSGSCPSWTTDVSATYSNKYIKINATQLTSAGVVLTGTSDSHVLSVTEIPAHTHTVESNVSGSSFGSTTLANSNSASDTNRTSSSTGGGGGHTHTLSSATTLEPSSITAKLCQVN